MRSFPSGSAHTYAIIHYLCHAETSVVCSYHVKKTIVALSVKKIASNGLTVYI